MVFDCRETGTKTTKLD